MDDYLLAGTRESVEWIQNLIARELEKLELEINADETTLVTLRHGVDFLGYHISKTIRVKRETRNKMLKTLSARHYEGDEKGF